MPEVWQRDTVCRSLLREPGYIPNPKTFPFKENSTLHQLLILWECEYRQRPTEQMPAHQL